MRWHEKTLVLSRIETRQLPRHSALRWHRTWLPATFPGWTPRRGLTTRVVHAIKYRVPLMSLRSGATPLDSSANGTSSARTVFTLRACAGRAWSATPKGLPRSDAPRDGTTSPNTLRTLGRATTLDRSYVCRLPWEKSVLRRRRSRFSGGGLNDLAPLSHAQRPPQASHAPRQSVENSSAGVG